MTAASYVRDLEATRELPDNEKFSGLLRLCAEAKQGKFSNHHDISRNLGDDYDELVNNLRRCAQVGLLVSSRKEGSVILPSVHAGFCRRPHHPRLHSLSSHFPPPRPILPR